MTDNFKKVLLFIAILLTILMIGNVCGQSSTVTFIADSGVSEIFITPDVSVGDAYLVNGEEAVRYVTIPTTELSNTRIEISNLPPGAVMKTTVEYMGESVELHYHPYVLTVEPHDRPIEIHVGIRLEGVPSNPGGDNTGDEGGNGGDNTGGGNTGGDGGNGGDNPGGDNTGGEDGDDSSQTPGSGHVPSVKPDNPVVPVVPDTPVIPDVPDTPSTPGSDEPGSDEPYLPILPPAGSVYNFAGFIPLVAGFLLLFLLFFWRRKVYRILKKHAKEHGEKPERKQLKATADAILQLIRDEEKYPKWRKNSDVAKRLSADIVSVLDEMNYARAVPRGALVAEILKAARGRINRHRL